MDGDERFDRPPQPSTPEIEEALLEVARELVVMSTDDLISGAVERLGHPPDDPAIVHLVEHVEEDLTDDFGPLGWLAGNRTVHKEALGRGIVLTHVLSHSERQIGALWISFDLAGFAWLDEPDFDGEPLEPVSAEPGHLAWMGPQDWLQRFETGATLAVRVGDDEEVHIEALAGEPELDDRLVAAVRQVYDDEVAEPGLPVSGEELLLGVLARERGVFDRPRATLSALCAAAGLEQRGAAVAHEPGVFHNAVLAGRFGRVFAAADDDRNLAKTVLAVLDLGDHLVDGEQVSDRDLRGALDDLTDPDVVAIVADELFDPRRPLDDPDPIVDALLAAADRPSRRAVARLVAALAAEQRGEWAGAEQHLELAFEADPDFVPTTDRLAWYAGDRGDAAHAARLWRRCPRSAAIARDLAQVEPFARPTHALGRNERCWCGSGRKYKQCHLGVPEQRPLPERVGWLCHKAVGYVERIGPEAREAVVDVIWARMPDDHDWSDAFDDPIVMDLVLTEGGWFRRFLTDREHLLPHDEALLAASWLTVDRSVHEILSVTPQVGLTLRDLRTGDTIEVRERAFTANARVGMMICARAVPDGDTNQLLGGVFPVAPGTEAVLLDLLDDRDPSDIATWVRDLYAAPQLRTREGEVVVDCEVIVESADTDALIAHLDGSYQIDVVGQAWSEHHDLDDIEAVVRAGFHLDADRLTITTNSHERADRILERLETVPGVTVVADRRDRVDVDGVRKGRRTGLPGLANLGSSLDRAQPTAEMIDELQCQMEERWCNESVPALGGYTPRQAAADPTRREQLERLLKSFDAMEVPSGAFSMRPDRLRVLLAVPHG